MEKGILKIKTYVYKNSPTETSDVWNHVGFRTFALELDPHYEGDVDGILYATKKVLDQMSNNQIKYIYIGHEEPLLGVTMLDSNGFECLVEEYYQNL